MSQTKLTLVYVKHRNILFHARQQRLQAVLARVFQQHIRRHHVHSMPCWKVRQRVAAEIPGRVQGMPGWNVLQPAGAHLDFAMRPLRCWFLLWAAGSVDVHKVRGGQVHQREQGSGLARSRVHAVPRWDVLWHQGKDHPVRQVLRRLRIFVPGGKEHIDMLHLRGRNIHRHGRKRNMQTLSHRVRIILGRCHELHHVPGRLLLGRGRDCFLPILRGWQVHRRPWEHVMQAVPCWLPGLRRRNRWVRDVR